MRFDVFRRLNTAKHVFLFIKNEMARFLLPLTFKLQSTREKSKMRYSSIRRVLAALVVFVGAGGAGAVVPSPAATASIDWATFNVQAFGVSGNSSPSFIFDTGSQNTYVNINFPGTSDSAGDWTSTLSVVGGVNSASSSASTLLSQFTSHPTVPENGSSVSRNGTFTLGSNSMVVFSVFASASIDMNAPLGGAAYAWAFLTAEGPDMFGGLDRQSSSTQKLVFAEGFGTPLVQSGKLFASFTNLSNGDIVGNLNANAIINSYGGTIVIVPGIPEPGTSAMLLAGLALLGTVAVRRRAANYLP
ncbi:MAG: PEP-CTERM sorting domain-containing protein [Rhodoferax sp.]|nr:PEP-CTERM sorting domain-containing protein [Rhodoferax sp.]